MPGEIIPRVEKLEERVDVLEDKVTEMKFTDTSLADQVNRIMSHIESEGLSARADLARIEKRLFGEEGTEYGGKIGFLTRDVNQVKIWVRAVIAATAILLFGFSIYEFFIHLKDLIP